MIATPPSSTTAPPAPSFGEAVRAFLKIGLLGFGGPAGQIALMHRILVEEKRWVSEARYLHALNYCMLLPGPEAQQLATYVGWLLHGVRGGVIAGVLFVLPGFLVILALSLAYATLGHLPLVAGLLFGLKAAVLAVVAEALLRVGRRALKTPEALAIAVAAFLAIAVLRIPFPLIVAAAGALGWMLGRIAPSRLGAAGTADGRSPPSEADEAALRQVAPSRAHALRTLLVWGGLWLLPVVLIGLAFGRGHVFTEEALFFSKTAVVTFGGAYAVLAYVAQQAVETHRWLRPDEMLTGLGLAETTPGPLILVLVFVGFLGGLRGDSGLDPIAAAITGAVITVWTTFAPSFLWIFLGAPWIEALRGNRALNGALSAITAAVVGVIANLAVWFALHVVFTEVADRPFGPLTIAVPQPASFDPAAAAIAAFAVAALFRLRLGMLPVLGLSALAGMALRLAG